MSDPFFSHASAAAFGQAVKVELVANPAPQGSVEAHWRPASDGTPLLSWIEPMNGGSFRLALLRPAYHAVVRGAHNRRESPFLPAACRVAGT